VLTFTHVVLSRIERQLEVRSWLDEVRHTELDVIVSKAFAKLGHLQQENQKLRRQLKQYDNPQEV